MKQFNKSFYTDDFDQEMLDFVKENFKITKYDDEWDLGCKFLKYTTTLGYFRTSDFQGFIHLTKQQFKDKIGMTDKKQSINKETTFTKSMLVSGEHVVKLHDGTYNLVIGGRIVDESGWLSLDHLTEDLYHCYNYNSPDLDVIAVYRLNKDFTLNDLLDGKELTLIWQRESPEKQKQREVVQTLEEDLKRAQKALKEAKNKLEEM